MKEITGQCPLCEEKYTESNRKSHHHLFVKMWFGECLNVVLEVCQRCHCKEFNSQYKMVPWNPWSKKTCVDNWIAFCKSKGKNALEIYPDLLREVVG